MSIFAFLQSSHKKKNVQLVQIHLNFRNKRKFAVANERTNKLFVLKYVEYDHVTQFQLNSAALFFTCKNWPGR